MFPPEAPTQPMPGEMAAGETPTSQTEQKPQAKATDKKRWQEFRQRVELNKRYKRQLIRNWTTNIDFRRGKLFNTQDDTDTVAVNLDWSYTKTKHASLFSQVPRVSVVHQPESLALPWVASYERKLNDLLKEAGVEATMDEVMPDCINAAGIGVALISYETITEIKDEPTVDISIFPPEIQQMALTTGKIFGRDIPVEPVPVPVARRYCIRRISPADFLWPTDFTGSDFNNAPWLGYSGRITWEEAKTRFNLDDAVKDKVLTDDRQIDDQLVTDIDKLRDDNDSKVGYDEIFYHEYQYNSEAKSFKTIHHLVLLHGLQEPVVDEAWAGQKVNPQDPSKVIGSQKKPLQVLTLTYLSDEDIPPSDSAVARAQVLELNRGRTTIARQRARNAPWTWYDVNRLDATIQAALLRGTWLNAIPVQGDGTRIIGTIQQPAIPQENYTFDQIAKSDAQELWTIGSNQVGTGGGVETKGEANVIQANFMTKVGRERAKVGAFFVNIAEVLGGLICLFEDPQQFGEGFDPTIGERLEYSILVDSTVLLDAQQRLTQLNNFVNTYAKSGWINVEPVLKEIATLVNLDPSTVVVKPEPQNPPPPNISLRLTGGDDMMNPLLLAFMLKTGQAPDPQLVEKAKELIQMSVSMTGPQTPPAGPMPGAPPVNTGEANPEASALPTITKNAEGTEGPTGPAAGGGSQ